MTSLIVISVTWRKHLTFEQEVEYKNYHLAAKTIIYTGGKSPDCETRDIFEIFRLIVEWCREGR